MREASDGRATRAPHITHLSEVRCSRLIFKSIEGLGAEIAVKGRARQYGHTPLAGRHL